MTCPYCLEPVNHGATVCKSCQRDIALVLTLTEAKHALEDRVQELEDELERLRPAEPETVVESPAVEEPSRKLGIVDLVVVYMLLPTLLLVGVHYLLVIRFDTNLIYLRAASIVLPAIFGWVLERKAQPRWLMALGIGVVVAFASVFGMSTMVHVTDGDPILPKGVVAWRETLEYITSIALAYMLGGVLSQGLRRMPARGTRRRGGLADKLGALMARHVTGRKGEPIEQRIQRMVKLVRLGISIATAVGAVYTGFKGIL